MDVSITCRGEGNCKIMFLQEIRITIQHGRAREQIYLTELCKQKSNSELRKQKL